MINWWLVHNWWRSPVRPDGITFVHLFKCCFEMLIFSSKSYSIWDPKGGWMENFADPPSIFLFLSPAPHTRSHIFMFGLRSAPSGYQIEYYKEAPIYFPNIFISFLGLAYFTPLGCLLKFNFFGQFALKFHSHRTR